MVSWRRSLSKPPPSKRGRTLRETVRVGTMVTPNVRLAEVIGEGAMGEVWVADHLTLKTQVAVKFISDEVDLEDPEVLARFNREASTAAQIKSPYVVQTFDQGVTASGTPYIVMELLEGEGLGDRLDRTGWLSLSQTAQVLTQTAKALGAAHKLGIVHRDIKPDNLFLVPTDEGFRVKVLDFGIAKETQLPKLKGLTIPGVLVGTPEFMSPEQVLTPSEVTFRADLWGLAVVAYVCVAGELPFAAEAVGELCVKLVEAKFKLPSEIRPDVIPPALDEWFKRALHRDPIRRFQSAKDMALAFVRALPTDTELFEEEVLDTGEHFLPSPALRPATAIGMGDGKLLPMPKPPPRKGPLGKKPPAQPSADAITLPRFRFDPTNRRKLAVAAAAASTLALALVVVLVATAGSEPAAATDEPELALTGAAIEEPKTNDRSGLGGSESDRTADTSSAALGASSGLAGAGPGEGAAGGAPATAVPTSEPEATTKPGPRPRGPRPGKPLPDPGF